MEHVAGSKRGPAWLELDSERTPVEVDRLDERGADAAHWVEHEVARLAVAADRFARERGQHLARVCARFGQVAVSPLLARQLLGDGPDRERG